MLFGLMGWREPVARLLGAAGWSLAAVWLLTVGGCAQTPASPTPVQRPQPPVEEPKFVKYEGSVFEPFSYEARRYWGPLGVTGIPGARVTIIGGQVDGWTAVTDGEGRFTWQDYPECELESAECRSRRFRVEKAGYETREVGASDPYRYLSSSDLYYSTSEKHIPMSREWPADAQIQRMLRELPAMDPLWLIERPELQGNGYYVGGIILTRSLEDLSTVAHEYCHAHQDWTRDPNFYNGDGDDWLAQTPEGRAFLAAWEADRPTNDPLLLSLEERRGSRTAHSEYAADMCAYYFVDEDEGNLGTVGQEYLRDRLPHLHAWAEEWMRHR